MRLLRQSFNLKYISKCLELYHNCCTNISLQLLSTNLVLHVIWVNYEKKELFEIIKLIMMHTLIQRVQVTLSLVLNLDNINTSYMKQMEYCLFKKRACAEQHCTG